MLKASALLSMINVKELTYFAKIETFTGNLVEVYMIVTVLYLIMTVPLAKIIAHLERRYRIPGLGMQQETRARQTRSSQSVTVRIAGLDLSQVRRGLPGRERTFI
jgi:hypothetical protein